MRRRRVYVLTKARHAAVIEKILHAAADVDLAGTAIPAQDVAVVLLDARTGMTEQDEPADELRRRLRQLVNLTVRGLRNQALAQGNAMASTIVLGSVAGLLAANATPHFVTGITKEPFPAPFSPWASSTPPS
jgi:hypothetical protein